MSTASLSLEWASCPASSLLSDEELRVHWDALNASKPGLPFLSSYAVAAALRAFGRGAEYLFVGRDAGSSLTSPKAMLILEKAGAGQWKSFQPSQMPLGLWVAAHGILLSDLARSLVRTRETSAFILSLTQIDPVHDLRTTGNDSHCVLTDYVETGWIDISGSFENYWSNRSKNLRSNHRKQRNRMASNQIVSEFVELREAGQMRDAVARYGHLESTGWKARSGTAVHAANAQGRFYTELMEAGAGRGEAVVYEYRFNGHTVVSNLCMERDGVLIVLKTAYDESASAGMSPAFLLREELLKKLFAEEKIRRLEFYGRLREWQLRWTDDRRTLYHLTYFRWTWLRQIKQLMSRRSPPLEAQDSTLTPNL